MVTSMSSRVYGHVKGILLWGDVLFVVGCVVYIAFRVHWSLRVWIGLLLALVGLTLWITARLQLGESFSIRPRARALVTTGLYARFRHPIYLFGFVAYTGLLVMWGRWILFLIYLPIYSVELLRLRKEERVLEQAFGEQYLRYRRQTWI